MVEQLGFCVHVNVWRDFGVKMNYRICIPPGLEGNTPWNFMKDEFPTAFAICWRRKKFQIVL